MACGCAVVCAENGGSRDYAKHGETALVVPPKRPDLLADAVSILLDDDDMRMRIASAGHARAHEYHGSQASTRIGGNSSRHIRGTIRGLLIRCGHSLSWPEWRVVVQWQPT